MDSFGNYCIYGYSEGQLLAKIRDPYLGTVRSCLNAPVHGTVAFVHDEAMTYENTAVFKLIKEEW